MLTVENIDPMMAFYADVLGFGLSDYIVRPFRAYFFHVNARHHSLALIETGRNGMHHLMVELFSLDDVGQAYDVAMTQQDRVSVTLGRHTNDFMTSFYAEDPVVLHDRMRLGRARDRSRNLEACRNASRSQPVGT